MMKQLRALWASLTAREIVQDEARAYADRFIHLTENELERLQRVAHEQAIQIGKLEHARDTWRELHSEVEARYRRLAAELHAARQEAAALAERLRREEAA